MTDDRFDYLCIFTDRIESEIYRASAELYRLNEFDFTTIPEANLARAERSLRDAADYLAKNLEAIRTARTKRAA